MGELNRFGGGSQPAIRDIEPCLDSGPPDASHQQLAAIAAAVYRARRRRTRLFAPSLFAEPAWDMLLDLFVHYAPRRRVSTTSLCVAAGIPSATGLRWISMLEGRGLLRRYHVPDDRRLTLVELSEAGYRRMRQFMTEEMVNVDSFPTP